MNIQRPENITVDDEILNDFVGVDSQNIAAVLDFNYFRHPISNRLFVPKIPPRSKSKYTYVMPIAILVIAILSLLIFIGFRMNVLNQEDKTINQVNVRKTAEPGINSSSELNNLLTTLVSNAKTDIAELEITNRDSVRTISAEVVYYAVQQTDGNKIQPDQFVSTADKYVAGINGGEYREYRNSFTKFNVIAGTKYDCTIPDLYENRLIFDSTKGSGGKLFVCLENGGVYTVAE